MRKIINVYGTCDEYSTLKIDSTVYGTVTVLYDSKYDAQLKQFNWCYESTKGVVYTMDLGMKTARILKCAGPKFYLQKYISYLHTGKLNVIWHRKNRWDYRVAHGIMMDG